MSKFINELQQNIQNPTSAENGVERQKTVNVWKENGKAIDWRSQVLSKFFPHYLPKNRMQYRNKQEIKLPCIE